MAETTDTEVQAKGAVVTCRAVPEAKVVFPEGAVWKTVRVCLQAEIFEPSLAARYFGSPDQVGPVIQLEPRRRKFHKMLTVMLPVPRATQRYREQAAGGGAPHPNTLRLLVDISGGVERPSWNDATDECTISFVNSGLAYISVSFSGRYWLVECEKMERVPDVVEAASQLYEAAVSVP